MLTHPETYDVIVIGGGHAGTEAALAAARAGARTLLLTHSIETVGAMSCNPAIGGIGKGHLVREIDALGGVMGMAADRAGIQWRTLNASKGPAVRATRCQADRMLYRAAIRHAVETQPNLRLFQQAVDDLMLEGDRVAGVVTQMGLAIRARTVVLTAGTFLAGRDPHRCRAVCGGPRRRSSRYHAGAASARAAAGRRPPEDRHTTAHRRAQRRFRRAPGTARRRATAVVFVSRQRRRASAAGQLLDHSHLRTHARRDPRGTGSLAAVQRPDRGRRSALLPVDRGQGGALRRQVLASDLPRTRGPRQRRAVPQRHLHLAALRRADRPGALDPGSRAGAHHAPRLCHRVRLLRSARAAAVAGDPGHHRPVFRRPDQRHHRLRGSRGAGPDRRPQRRARQQGPRALVHRAATRPTSAC